MAVTNRERAGRAMELLRQGPVPFAERENESVTKASEAEPKWTDSGGERQ